MKWYYIVRACFVKSIHSGSVHAATGGRLFFEAEVNESNLNTPATTQNSRSSSFHYVTIAIVIAAMAGLTWLHLQRQPRQQAVATTNPATQSARPLDLQQFRGISIQVHEGAENHPYDKFIREIAATGANTVCIVVNAYQQNCGSSSIFIESRKTPPERRLRELFALSHQLGMKVILMPIVLLEKGRKDEWRGKINPELDKNSWDDWWENYTNYILYYAGIAQTSGVDVFMVGSELVSTETQTDRWCKLITQVRGAYKGYLSYSANWDHYKVIHFWDKLDIIGMTTYYDLCGSKPPTLETLKESWSQIHNDLIQWQSTVGKPLLFTEVGWPNQVTAAKEPWNYYAAQNKPDPGLQRACYQSFFDTWANEPALGGYMIWEWRTHDAWVTGPMQDTSYCPKDKPAMELISAHFRAPNGHTSIQPTTTTTSNPTSRQTSNSTSQKQNIH